MGLLDWAYRAALGTPAGPETRAARGSLPSPVQWTAPTQGLIPTWDGRKAVDSAYNRNLYVFRCIDATANAIARLPFRAVTDPEKPQDFATAGRSKLAYLLSPAPGSPNPQWSARQLWKYSITQYLVTGKWAWLNEYNANNQLIRLWPIPAQYLEPVPVPWGSRGDDYFASYIYRARGKEMPLTKKQVSYFWNPSQSDHLQPESPLGPAAGRIGLAQMLERYDLALMKNNGVPTTIITTEPFATKEDRRAFRQQFVTTFGGYDNAGKTMFLEADSDIGADGSESNNVAGKISVERLGMTAEEMQQNEKYSQVIDDILVALGTPKSVLGIASDSTFANGGQELTNWWNEKLLPLKSDLEDQINVRLAPKVGRHVGVFDTSKVAALKPAEPTASELTAMAKADASPTGPVLTRDEVRARMGLPPWAEADHPADAEPAEETAPEPVTPAAPVAEDRPSTEAPAEDTAQVRRMLTRVLSQVLAEQRSVVEQRVQSRKGRKAGSLAELFDVDWHSIRAAATLEPVLSFLGLPATEVEATVRRLVGETRERLHVKATPAEAFRNAESRTAESVDWLIDQRQPVPADHVVVLLDAVRAGKVSAQRAQETWEAAK